MNIDQQHEEALNAIEEVELLSLRWGDVNGSLDRVELLDIVALKVGTDYAEEIVESLIDSALIYAFDVSSGERYRSRFAEAMRLLVNARQIFWGETWRGAPFLVSDFRVDLRQRRYPRRDRDPEELVGALDHIKDLQREVFSAISPEKISRFQESATRRLLSQFHKDIGTIITAGTGSGKTWAFYLPVLTRISELATPREYWTKAIAIYPRNELLKDQLTEAYRNVRKANAVLNRPGCRPLRLGAYFGYTPKSTSDYHLKNWRKATGDSQARVCPFLRCDCDGDLHWNDIDRSKGRERLVCALECGHVYEEQVLPLTRKSIRQRQPDIIFTTTEMLNRSLSDQYNRHLFGVNVSPARQPKFLLLDEAHTYNGVAGAQVALALRRWRALLSGPIHWVGLSATLEQAQTFFAHLTGLYSDQVSEVSAAEEDMDYEGREYQLVIRGDPASSAALLSTSIQAAMLIARILDTPHNISQGRFGTKLFAFTDDLDVTHRLFDDLRHAEGYDVFENFEPTRGTLAALRDDARRDGDRRERENAAQIWNLPKAIGHNLSDPLTVARTTSRDPGVNREANVIVATSALEVGFNDPDVGAILQHKAPRNFASFLQRRGRAGRHKRMRPLTVTVLSDYGRDRQLFQSFEHLFEPALTVQSLPIQNQYVLRMQATFALLDWIAYRPTPDKYTRGHVWRTASMPSSRNFDDSKFRKHLRNQLSLLVKGDQEALDALAKHLKYALNVDDETINRILWEPPRSILLEVAPTLLRRIYRDWKLAWGSSNREYEQYIFDHPIPEAVPRTLFADLNLPDVEISLPAATKNSDVVPEYLPIQQALTLCAPGNVSRRFGDAYGGLAHWFPVPLGKAVHEISVDDFSEVHELVGQFDGEGEEGHVNLPVYRPWSIRLEKATRGNVRSTSKSFLSWASDVVGSGTPVSISPPIRTAWREVVRDLRLFLHQFDSGVSVRRFATGACAEIKRPRQEDQIVDVTFVTRNGEAAAVGYEFETDGLALDLKFNFDQELTSIAFEPSLERALRSILFAKLTVDDKELPRDMNKFQREWLRQIFLLTAVRRSKATGKTLVDSAEALVSESDALCFEEILNAMIGVQHTRHESGSDNGELEVQTDEEDNHRNRLDRLKNTLIARLEDRTVRSRIFHSLQVTLSGGGKERSGFLRRTLESTIADALVAAVSASAPRHVATESLVADVIRNPEVSDEFTIWITETTVGGAGVLQAMAVQYARYPRSFYLALEAVLEPSDLEMTSEALRQTYELMISDEEVGRGVGSVRGETSHKARTDKREKLLDVLDERGVEFTRSFVVSLNSRILTPGARKQLDNVVLEMLNLWDATENAVGLELDQKEVAVLGALDDVVLTAGKDAGLFRDNSRPNERARALEGLLWPKTDALRRKALETWTPFRNLITPVPQLVRSILLDSVSVTLSVDEDGWRDALVHTLSSDGSARLEVPIWKSHELKLAIFELLAYPVAVGHLQFYPVLERISKDLTDREDRKYIAHFIVREQV